MFAFFIFLFVEIDIEDCVTNSTLSLSHYAVQFHGLRNSFIVSSLYFEQAMMYRVLQWSNNIWSFLIFDNVENGLLYSSSAR